MRSTLRLGRIRGVEVGINWTWLLAFGLIVWTLAAGVFPATNGGLPAASYLAMAVIATILFFGSILLHELGHALRARREGMEIDRITLWVFGGVAAFRGMFPSAGAEFRIAIAGPLVSLVIGASLVLAAHLIPLPAAVDGVVAWVGQINLILLAFNLLPALPLDGGRVLRSLLWKVKGDFAAATRVAAALGTGFGALLIVAGLLLALTAGALGGLWLAVIGWFLVGAAQAEGRLTAARETLAGTPVAGVMVREPVTARPDASLSEFIDGLGLGDRHALYPVTDNGHPLGVLPLAAVARVPAADRGRRHVRDVMVPPERVVLLHADDDMGDALTALAQSEFRRALVVDGGDLVGVLSLADAVRPLKYGRSRRLTPTA